MLYRIYLNNKKMYDLLEKKYGETLFLYPVETLLLPLK